MGAFGWLPVGVDARVRATPWGTMVLTAGLAAVFGLVLLTREDPTLVYGLAFKPAAPSVLTAVTALFVNLGVPGFLSALLFLCVFGPPLESRIGVARTLIAFLASGWFANLAQAWAVLVQAGEQGPE